MLQLDNFFAWISVDDQELVEYGVEYSADLLSATCWIASEEGKAFTIYWRDVVRTQNSMGRTYVDGVKCGVSKGINRKGYRQDAAKERDTAQQRGVATSSSTDRLLVFSKLELTDDDAYLNSSSDKLGEIRLEILYVRKGDQTRLDVKPFKAESKVHEMTKKLTQHHTKLGKSVKSERKQIHSVKSLGDARVFVFKYRPLEVLRAMGIVPKEPKREPKDVSRVDLPTLRPADSLEVIDLTMDPGNDDSEQTDPEPRETVFETSDEEKVKVKKELMFDGTPNLKAEEGEYKDTKAIVKKSSPSSSRVKVEHTSSIKFEDEIENKYDPSTENFAVKHEFGTIKTESGLAIKQEPNPIVKSEMPLITEPRIARVRGRNRLLKEENFSATGAEVKIKVETKDRGRYVGKQHIIDLTEELDE